MIDTYAYSLYFYKHNTNVNKNICMPNKKTSSKTLSRPSTTKKTTRTAKVTKHAAKRTFSVKNVLAASLHKLIIHAVIVVVAVAGIYAVVNFTKVNAVTAVNCYKNGTLVKPDTSVKTKYGINGFFMYTTANACISRSQIEKAHQIGANTVFTIGSTLKPTTRSAAESDATFSQFKVNGRSGFGYAIQRAGNVKVNRIFTYNNKETFASRAFNCGNKNGVTNIGYDGRNRSTIKGVFSWWLFPVDGSFSGCTSPTNTYDLVVAYSKSPYDANEMLVNTAQMYGMKAYLGTPKPQRDPKVGYVADISYLHTLGSFTTRVFVSWNQRYADNPAFSGAYQTLETSAYGNRNIWNPNLRVYAMQNQILTWHLPTAKERMVISPYVDLNFQTTAMVTSSFRDIVNTANGARVILMPQDGVGTGRVGLSRVSSMYAAAKQAGAKEFWANIEAFKPGGSVGIRPLTDKATLDRQIAAAHKYTPVVMSFDWNQFKSAGIYDQLVK